MKGNRGKGRVQLLGKKKGEKKEPNDVVSCKQHIPAIPEPHLAIPNFFFFFLEKNKIGYVPDAYPYLYLECNVREFLKRLIYVIDRIIRLICMNKVN